MKVKELSEEEKAMLQEAMDYCDSNDKSTEFMLEYMQDVSGLDFDTVMKFILHRNTKNSQT